MSERLALRVMTFNVRGAYHADGANAWPERAALNVETIRRHAPDLIGLQEAQGPNLKVYARELPSYHAVAWPHYGDAPPHEWPAILWRADRLRPLEADGFWLSETPAEHSRSWVTDCIRAARWVRFRCLASGAELVHLNTHLDHVSETARVEGTRLILDRLDGLQRDGAAAVVTGDFNTEVGSPACGMFVDAGFIDAHAACGNDEDPSRAFTYHGWQGEGFRGSDSPPRRIDWILLRDGARTRLRPRSCAIVRDASPPHYPSDHYPVVADVEVSRP